MVLASNSIRVAALSKPFVPMLLSYYWIAAVVSLGSIRAAEPIAARDTKIDNVGLHYLTAGKGPAVLLLHGYAETSRMWRPKFCFEWAERLPLRTLRFLGYLLLKSSEESNRRKRKFFALKLN